MRTWPERALTGYKRWISPMFPPACRYVPTCSEYAAEAVVRLGVLRGSLLAVRRLLRCHPFAAGGYDPVPCEHDHSPCTDSEIDSTSSKLINA